MSWLLLLLSVICFVILMDLRISTLVGKKGAVHRQTRHTRQTTANRKRLERNLHPQS